MEDLKGLISRENSTNVRNVGKPLVLTPAFRYTWSLTLEKDLLNVGRVREHSFLPVHLKYMKGCTLKRNPMNGNNVVKPSGFAFPSKTTRKSYWRKALCV